MARIIHVTCGASAAGRLSKSSEDVAILRDHLSDGPLGTLRDIESWGAMRHAFWELAHSETEYQKSPQNGKGQRWSDFPIISNLDRVAKAEEVVLWIGIDLADQITLAWMPQFLRAIGNKAENLRVVQFERMSDGEPILNLGRLPEVEFRKHPPPRPLNDAELADLDAAWDALIAPNPASLVRFLGRKSAPLPLLQSAMKSLLHRYPDARSGLNRFDWYLLMNTRDHGPTAAPVISETLMEFWDDIDDPGDVTLFWRLQRLAAPSLPHPAIRMTGAMTTIRQTEVRLTAVGEQILNGECNFVQLNGIDDWVGGVHLDSRSGNVWFHRDGAIIPG